MSSITLSPNSAGTAQFTIAAPGTNTNRTLTLPDASSTLATTADVTAGDATQIGVGQTWQSPTRAKDTVYQNTTGKPIMALVSITRTSTAVGRFEVSTDNVTWVNICAIPTGATGAGQSEISAIIPNNIYYRLNETSAGITVQTWAELR